MVWYASKHKYKDNLGTFGSILGRLEAFWNSLNAFRVFWVLMRAFCRLGRLGTIIPYVCMVCNYVSIGIIAYWKCLGVFWERLELYARVLGAFGCVCECFGTF